MIRAQAAKIRLSIKRDDETDLLATGNKIRKLSFLLADALSQVTKPLQAPAPRPMLCAHLLQGSDTIVTIGGEQSNHARATALLAQVQYKHPALAPRCMFVFSPVQRVSCCSSSCRLTLFLATVPVVCRGPPRER
jgi:hypothetical protein